MSETLSNDARELLAWKAGLTYFRPLSSYILELHDKGYVSEGDIMSSKLTEKGTKLVEQWRSKDA